MTIKTGPVDVWAEYQSGVDYNTRIGLYENVRCNNNFYNDKQWEGSKAVNLDKPVFNFLKPAVNYYIAMLISDEITANVELNGADTDAVERAISREIANVMERENMSFKNRQAIRNAAVDGDCCFYNYFDPDAETGQLYEGQIRTELVDNTNILFGDPSTPDVQSQPYLIIAYRRLTESVREEAGRNGADPDAVTPDDDALYANEDKNEQNYTTVLLKMWKKNKTVHMVKCTQNAMLKKEWDTGYRLYPVAYMCWERVKNSCHGAAPLTGKIQNQIFVNKLYAMAMMYVTRTAFPKILYDKARFPQGWDNRVDRAIGVQGDPTTAVFANFQAAEMSASVPNLINSTITQTKDLMGANETALGNVQPDNTSAIITVQNQARVQLGMQRLDFYSCVEEYIRSFVDMMRVHYGARTIEIEDENKNPVQVEFDFSTLDNYTMDLKVDVGQGSYWSEIMQLQTLDNLYAKKVIPNAISYLEMLPDGVIKNKQKLIDQWAMMPAQEAAGIGTAEGAALPEGQLPEPRAGVQAEAPAARTSQAGDPETDQMKEILDELSSMRPDQIQKTLEVLPVPDEDKANIVDVLRRRGVL